MFVSFILFNLTLDERKTLTKISTRKPLTTVPQTSASFGTRKEAKSIMHPFKNILDLENCSPRQGSRQRWTQEIWDKFVSDHEIYTGFLP